MPESFMNFTEGSGKKAHTFQRTIGGNNVEDEVIVTGEPYLASYIATFWGGGAAISTATANSHICQLMAGASLKVRVRRIEIWQAGLATAATLAQFIIVRLTTAGTGGTNQGAPLPLDPSDAGAGATYMTLPTVKGAEGAQYIPFQTYMLQTVAASAPLVEPIAVLDFDRPRSKPLIIAAGTANGIAVKNVSAVAGATVWVNMLIDETSF